MEGYFESMREGQPGRSDRLLKLDTVYGTIQLGYSPRRRQSFLFATNKSSIFGAAASRYQRELADYQAMRSLKTGTQNIAFSARRKPSSAVLIYKMETLPWSHRSISPYLDKADMGTLTRTMPFLDARAERREMAAYGLQQRALKARLRQQMNARQYAEMAPLRAQQVRQAARQSALQALLYRKDAQGRWFFRRLNIGFDLQKQQMFAYYRNLRQGLGSSHAAPEAPIPNKGEDEDE